MRFASTASPWIDKLEPCWFCPQVVTVVMPMAIVVMICVRRSVYDMHHDILGKFLAPPFP